MSTNYVQIVSTFASRTDADSVGGELVRRRLAACAQVGGPITSTYHWNGAVETSDEWTLTIKTRGDRWEAVRAAIKELHAYETPEILCLPAVAGDESYFRWIDESLGL
jgi:periplasmic divalent cation tolerance protein